MIEHFERRFEKIKKATGVDASDFTFKSEGIKIQHSFNSERLEKLSNIERSIKLNKFSDALDIITEGKVVNTTRNKIQKIADKHGWDTVKEYLDSPLADNKDDASDLSAAISRAARKRYSKPYNRPEDQLSGTGRGKFNPRSFFRGFSQVSRGSATNGNNGQEVQKCFYCNQPGHFARSCPLRGNPTATVGAPKIQDT